MKSEKVQCERCGRKIPRNEAVINQEHGFKAFLCRRCSQALFLETEEF